MKHPLIVGLVALNLVLLAFAVIPDKSGQNTVERVVEKELGSVSGPDISSPYFSYGGVRHWGARTESLIQASTTICALQSPAATSTLIASSLKFTTAATSTQVITAGVGTTRYTINTMLATSSVAANVKATVDSATTTPVSDSTNGRAVLSNQVFSPNTYLLYQFATANAYTAPAGVCQATWIEN